jgi:hypothetical protein
MQSRQRSCMPMDCWPGRPKGHGPAEIMQAWQASGVWASGDRECLWIAGLAGLRGAVRWRSCRCEWWEFGGVRTGGAEEQAQGLEIPQPVPLAVLLVNHGMGKPSMS